MHHLAKEFAAQGFDPLVITPDENLAEAWSLDKSDGVDILRLRIPYIDDSNYIGRAVSELLLSFRMIRILRRTPLWRYRWDAIVWYSPTIFFGPLISLLKRQSNCRTYLILRDIFPEWMIDLRLINKGFRYFILKLVAKYQYYLADTIGVQSPSNLRYFPARKRFGSIHVEVLQNWLEELSDVGSSIQVESTPIRGRKIFVYIGNMGVAQSIDIFIDLADSLRHRDDIGFLFVGRGSELPRLRNLILQKQLNNILFFDEIDPSEIPGLLSQCDVGIVALDTRHKSHNIPGKFLSYVQAGLPVLARTKADSDLGNLIISEGIGRVYVGDDICELRQLAEQIIVDTGLVSMSVAAQDLSKKMFVTSVAVSQIVAAVTEDR